MWAYVVIGLMVLFGVLAHDLPGKPAGSGLYPRMWTHVFWILIVALAVMAGLRFRIGLDTGAMRRYYNYAPMLWDLSLDSFGRFSGGRHILLYSLCKSVGVNIWPIQLAIALTLNLSVGWLITRFTRKWFLALGFYLAFAYINLNFEIMYQGMAAAFLIMAFDDFRLHRWGRFYLKLLAGALFHLSLLSLFWLPILGYRPVMHWLRPGWRPLAAACVIAAVAFGVRWLLLNKGTVFDGSPVADTLRFNSEGIRDYADEMLGAPGLNWKGIMRRCVVYVIVPLGAVWLLSRTPGKEWERGCTESRGMTCGGATMLTHEALATLMMVFVIFSVLAFVMAVFQRLAYYLILFVCAGGADSLMCVRSRLGRLCWLGAVSVEVVLMLYHYAGRLDGMKSGYLYEIYVPYASFIDKGLSHHREWMYHNHFLKMLGKPEISEEEFYFSLEPGTYYLDPPLQDTTGRRDTGMD